MALAVPVLIHSKSIPSSLRLLEMSVSVASSRKSGEMLRKKRPGDLLVTKALNERVEGGSSLVSSSSDSKRGLA